MQTSTVYLFGLSTLVNFTGYLAFSIQLVIMIAFCLLIYGLLLFGKKQSIQNLLLVGVILGSGLRSFSSFMTRLLSPNEFDILQARLFASVNNASSENFPIAIPLLVITAILLFMASNKLNVISLGKDISINLGINYKKTSTYILVLVAVLMSISTALIGPLTFLGFLISLLSHQMTETYDHKFIFPLSVLLAYLVLTAGYF
ncbi:iron ABC transporter permease, partial [Rhodovulum adriaticum]|nr:iron ABC transporter permease [Rhodovulum adriaticum]